MIDKETIVCKFCGVRNPSYELWCVSCEQSLKVTDEELLQQAHVIKPFIGLIPKKVAK